MTGLHRAGIWDQRRLAQAALTWLAEPADVQLGALLAACGPVAVLAGIRAGNVPAAYRASSDDDHAAMTQAVRRWQARLRGVPGADVIAARCRDGGLRVICPGDQDWPVRLDDLGLARPYALWVRGNGDLRSCMEQPVTVTGSRAATGYGMYVADEIAQGLAGQGRVTVSGAAYGIDAAAHRGALAAGGVTVAVLAGGVDRPYPAGHADLFARIAAGGLLAGEQPPGTHPTRRRFAARSRVLAALGGATVVIEAGEHSGALTVAVHAAELGRPVMAVPGPVTSAQSAGCHALIRDRDAVLVTSASQVTATAGTSGTRRPGIVNGLPVVAALAVGPQAGELPGQWYVVCCDQSREPGRQHIVWTAAFDPGYQGGQWVAGNGRYDLSCERAVAVMHERSDASETGKTLTLSG